MDSIYQPQEDSYLLIEHMPDFVKGKVLDMGTGTGVLAFEAHKNARFVVALDINPEAVKFVQNLVILKKINNVLVRDSNLFSFLHNNFVDFDRKNKQFRLTFDKSKNTKFDTIIFNPPYLPKHKGEEPDVDLYVSGGKYGYEIIEDFICDVNEHLDKDGNVLLVFSSLTNKRKVEEAIDNNLLKFEVLGKKKMFMEELYCYRLYKSHILKLLEKRGLTQIKRLTKGHRGWIFKAYYKGRAVVVKKQREDVAAKDRIKNEIKFLKVLNKHNIGPKIIMAGNDYFVYNFIDGVFIKDLVENEKDKKKIKEVFLKVFKKMYKLDKLKINKEEMHHPKKHVIINEKGKVKLIDFERANKTDKPKNVTQFVQYVASFVNSDKKKEKLRNLAKQYKKDMSLKNYKAIIENI